MLAQLSGQPNPEADEPRRKLTYGLLGGAAWKLESCRPFAAQRVGKERYRTPLDSRCSPHSRT